MPTNLSSEFIIFVNVLSDHPNPTDKCPMYNARGEQRNYNIKQWHGYQIKQQMKKQPEATNKQNWHWFQHDECYTQQTFIKCCQQMKANEHIKCLKSKKPPKTPSAHTTMANKTSQMSFKYKYDIHMDILYKILNSFVKEETLLLFLNSLALETVL